MFKPENTHIIGGSMGSLVASYVGSYFEGSIFRITGKFLFCLYFERKYLSFHSQPLRFYAHPGFFFCFRRGVKYD